MFASAFEVENHETNIAALEESIEPDNLKHHGFQRDLKMSRKILEISWSDWCDLRNMVAETLDWKEQLARAKVAQPFLSRCSGEVELLRCWPKECVDQFMSNRESLSYFALICGCQDL